MMMNSCPGFFSSVLILVGIVAFPAAAAGALFFRRCRGRWVTLSPWTALPAVLAAALIRPPYSVDLEWLFLGARFGIDSVSGVFLLFTAVVWWAAGVYAGSYLKDDPGARRFFISFLLAMCGNFGLILSQDVISFYCFFALMSFASYGLVVHSGTEAAREAGKVYITLVVVGELMVFSALALAVFTGGSLLFSDLPARIAISPNRDLIIVLTLLGFGVKAGALPLHVWLPLAHPVAPTPASAVLSAAMIKAGLLGWLRLLPLGEAAFSGWGGAVLAAGFAAAFYGVIAGVVQDKPKTVLAYSSISQMGLITVIVGAALADPKLWPVSLTAILIYATHHAFAKGALFLGVSVVPGRATGGARRLWIGAAFLLPALAICGAPLTSGYAAKGALKTVFKKSLGHFHLPEEMLVLLTLSALGTTFLLARFFWAVWNEARRNPTRPTGTPVMLIFWGTLVAVGAGLPFFRWFTDLRVLVETDAHKVLLFDFASLGPLAAGAGISVLLIMSGRRVPLRIPAGDILGIYRGLLNRARVLADILVCQPALAAYESFSSLCNALIARIGSGHAFWGAVDRGDAVLGISKIFGAGLLILMILFFTILMT